MIGRMETGPESRAENRRGPSAAPAPSPGLSPEFAPALAPERTPERASERSSEQTPELSVVAPVYNEEESVSHFVAELEAVLSALNISYEIILVDDGSRDRSWEVIAALAPRHPALRALRLSRNFGHQGALLAGLAAARGRAVISMDSDLQHPPRLIPEMLAAWREGNRIVNTRRLDRGVTGPVKRATSSLYYRIFSYLSEVELQDGSSDFRLLDRSVLNALLSLGHSDIFIRGAVQMLGFRTTTLPFHVQERFAGASKFTLRKMLRLARSGIIAHSTRPLTIGIWLGLVMAALSMGELAYVLLQTVRGGTIPGWASVVGVITILFAVTFIMLGLIGAYIASMHRTLHRRPGFIVDEQL